MMENVSIEEFAVIVRGSSPRPSGDPRYYGGTIPRLMVSDVTRDGMYVTPKIDFLTEEGATKSRAMLKGDLIIAVSGDPGEPCILNVDACIHDGFVGLRNINKKRVFTPYLYQFLKFNKKNNRDQAVGAIYKNLNTDQIKNLQIPLPPLETQQKIAAILDAADTLRQKDKALVAKYDELTQALFLDMFGDVISNNKNWESKKFEEIISLKRGYDLPNNDRKKGDIPVVASTGIVGYHNEVKVKGGCIVTGRSGSIGKVQLITVDCWPLNTSLYGYKTFNNNLVYLKYFVSYFRIERFSHGAGVPTLDRKLVHKELAPLPPIELQHLFAERINAIEQQKAIAQASLEKSEELFNSLLQKAFKGELV